MIEEVRELGSCDEASGFRAAVFVKVQHILMYLLIVGVARAMAIWCRYNLRVDHAFRVC